MQMALALLPALGGAASAAGAAATGSAGLGALAFGTSAVSALSKYGLSKAEAASQENEAAHEQLAGRQEYVQAQEKANAINAEYQQTAGAQLADAAAMGLDIASGSVVEAQRQTAQAADRQVQIGANSADMNAAMRRARAASLQGAAATTKAWAPITLASDLIGAGIKGAQIGGYKAPKLAAA